MGKNTCGGSEIVVDFRYADSYGLNDLREIMALLRGEQGCPWDREQTHQSIRRNMLEEAYEACEAIDEKDDDHLKEELGDVLLQVVFHCRMAQERGAFTLDEVIDGICKKLIFRHPHVFETAGAENSDGALKNWEGRKREEKGQTTAADSLDAVARSLPALIRAEKIQSKANKAGFDWPDIGPALDKVAEELGELRQAVQEQSNLEEELGDLLFAAVKVGCFFHARSEEALHAACEKFIRRFRSAQRQAPGESFQGMTLPQLEALWKEAKQQET